MRKKILFIPLWGIFALSLLSSCRTEDGAIAQKQIEDKRFAVFVPKSGKTVNYANGFASLMKKYDQVHLTNISGINNKPIIKNLSASANKSVSSFQDIGKYVEFNVRSQTVIEENGNKWVAFPKVENEKVTGLIIATLRDKETQVVFTDLDSNDQFYTENLPLFQQALDRYLSKKKSKLNVVASIKNGAIASVDPGADPGTDPPAYETDIEGVTVKGKPKPSDNGTNGLPSGPSTPIACEQIQGCYNPAETGGGSAFPSPSASQLQDLIRDKPFVFVDVPCDIVKKWLTTAKFVPAQAQLNKLKTIVDISSSNSSVTPGGITVQRIASLQRIDDAYSTAVNMDYFPITVNQLPVINGTRLTPEQFLNHIRININQFVDTYYSEFTPYNNYGVDDRALWNSSNPLGAVIKIDIKGPDNGSVIVTDYKSDKWIFSTIYEPIYKTHPVSGNRDFGFIKNDNGSYTFYTRGVDRLTSMDATTVQNSEFLSYMMGGSPFSQADALWTSFQNKINNFVNSHQGSSSVASQEIYRPDWAKVKAVIEGKEPLSGLSKDCGK